MIGVNHKEEIIKTELVYLTWVTALTGVSNAATAGACVTFFWARVVHALAYTFAVPWVRTLSFAVGFFAQATLAWQVLAGS